MVFATRALVALAISVLSLISWVPSARADEDGERAAALRQHGLTLAKSIKSAADLTKGPAVFANVHIGKRGNFAVNVDCVVSGERTGVTVDEKGKATKKEKANRDRGNEKDYPKIAAEFTAQKVTLDELVTIAEKEAGGTAINTWGYLKDDKVLVRVLVVTKTKKAAGGDEEKTVQVVVDPSTKKVVKESE